MPQAKVLTSVHSAEVRCPVNFRTQEMASACDQYSLSKLVQKKSQQSQKGELTINVELITEAIRAAARKQMNEMKMEIEMMSPVVEKSEEEMFESEKENENKSEDTEKSDPDFELEPVRFDFYSTRRRSKQFYDVNKETSEKGTNDQRKVPVFNLGRSFKNLYHKDKESEMTETQTEYTADTVPPSSTFPVDYDSDSAILNHVRVYKPLRKIKSLPEIHRPGYSWNSDNMDLMGSGHSNSITDLSRNWKQPKREMQKGPGYAFLASVADNLIGKQPKTVALRADTSLVKDKRNIPAECATTEVGVNEVKVNKPVVSTEPAPVVAVPENKHKQSIFKSVQDWGTKRQTVITKREMNMYMPTSF